MGDQMCNKRQVIISLAFWDQFKSYLFHDSKACIYTSAFCRLPQAKIKTICRKKASEIAIFLSGREIMMWNLSGKIYGAHVSGTEECVKNVSESELHMKHQEFIHKFSDFNILQQVHCVNTPHKSIQHISFGRDPHFCAFGFVSHHEDLAGPQWHPRTLYPSRC